MNGFDRILGRTKLALRLIAIVGLMAGLHAPSARAADTTTKPAVDPSCDKWLKRMSDYLAQAQSFSVNAEIWQDVNLASGQQVQAGRNITLQVRRPNLFHAEMHSTRHHRELYYDGKSITLVNRDQNFYGTIPAPASMDEAMDTAIERFGIAMPLEDLVVSDPYQSAMKKIVSGTDIGPVTVLGTPCEHLAFSLGSVDWQVWVEDGARPVPRKIVFTYKDEENSPQFIALFSHWDFEGKLPDFLFNFEPPPGASKIGVAAIKAQNDAQKKEGK